MLECLNVKDGYAGFLDDAFDALDCLATAMKAGIATASILDGQRTDFLDSLADQVVTAVGVGHCAVMDMSEACKRVNKSNWSKFVDGQPVFTDAGKIAKGPDYAPPDLRGLA
jgi:hypothetical protein